jgi:hypothetical protein
MRLEPRGPAARARDRLVASDPGLSRLRTALRATLGAGATAATLPFLAPLFGRPTAEGLVGVSLAMTSAVAVTARAPAAQAKTFAWMP